MRKLASVAVVFAGLSALITSISLLTFALFNLQAPDPQSPTPFIVALVGLVPSGAAALLGFYLIHNRHYLPVRWFADESVDTPVDPVDLLRLGLVLLGVSLAVNSLGSLFSTITFVIRQSGPSRIDGWQLIDLLRPVSELAIGAVLVWKARPFSSRLWLGADVIPEVAQDDRPLCPSCAAPYDPDDYEPDATARCSSCGEQLSLRA